MKTFYRVFRTGILISSLLIPASFTFAQSSSGITIEPTLIEKSVSAGDVITDQIRVTNKDSVAHTYYLSVKDIKDVLEGGLPVVADKPGEVTGFDLSSWVNIGASTLDVGPGASKYVPVKITVPKSPSPGAHFGEVFVSLQPPKVEVNGAGAGVGYDIGTIISLRVAGKTVDMAELHEFKSENLLYSNAHIKFFSTLVNAGNTLVRPQGTLGVTDMFGKKVATLVVNESNGALIPGGRRTYTTEWNEDGFAFGKYNATVAFSYGEGSEGKKSIYGETSFWILPMNILIPVLLTILILGLSIYVGARMYVKRQLKGHERSSGGGSSRSSSLTMILIALILFTLVFLAALFFLFA